MLRALYYMHCYALRRGGCLRAAGRRGGGLRVCARRRAGAYLTDLEVELAPPLLRLEAEHGGEHAAQGPARFHIHEYFHLEINRNLSK